MKLNRIFLAALLLALGLFLYFTFSDQETNSSNGSVPVADTTAYNQEIRTERIEKDEFMRTNADSPIADKPAFTGLLYYGPDPAYRVTARLEPFADKTQKLIVRMSDGTEEVYSKVAHAVFSLGGSTHRLLIVSIGDTYSILFRDATSNKETYGGGRYLDLDADQLTGSRTVLDFNTAYNPYCAYNPGYACPIPPAENVLDVSIKAGERYVPHE
ncbi:MAG: DUF1684 domain-containing protein [Spirosoma sp.]|nr:DUF1684 domain-containing protein [Spirosoma sp.]